jgi:hypothetical protein
VGSCSLQDIAAQSAASLTFGIDILHLLYTHLGPLLRHRRAKRCECKQLFAAEQMSKNALIYVQSQMSIAPPPKSPNPILTGSFGILVYATITSAYSPATPTTQLSTPYFIVYLFQLVTLVISCDSLMYLLTGDGSLIPPIGLQARRSDNKSCGPRWNRVHSSWQKEGKTNAPKVSSFPPHGKRSIFPKTGYECGQVGGSFRFRPVLSCSAR